MRKLKLFIPLVLALHINACSAQKTTSDSDQRIVVGAERFDEYLVNLKDKRVAIVANQTSMVQNTHLVDTLLDLGVNIVKIFGPEHGFRELASAGEHLDDATDPGSGLPIISLYGSNRKPTEEHLSGIDIVLFDIQDVGCRFYTYISTLQYVMESCAEVGISVIVLDRPNPNISYVDGPVLEPEFRSFVGLNEIPIVYGLTIGEYGNMINEEGWLENKVHCELEVVKLKNYTRDLQYELPVLPSSNLPNFQSVKLYPSLCLFEGTDISVGRGTEFPFQVIGFPGSECGEFTFVPESVKAAKSPKHQGKNCRGTDLQQYNIGDPDSFDKIELKWLIDMYRCYNDKENFFNAYFEKLAGNTSLRNQIIDNVSENEIRASWKPALTRYIATRNKYLLYD